MKAPTNPIEKELAKLEDQWNDFLDTELPIMHWIFSPADTQLALTFVKVKQQLDEKDPQLFIHLTSEFTQVEEYGEELAQEINKNIQEGLDDALLLESEEGKAIEGGPQWQTPDLATSRSGFQAFFRTCNAAVEAFDDYVHALVLVITPTGIDNLKEYVSWWRQCCDINTQYTWPRNLRLLVLDIDPESDLAKLAREKKQHMHSVVAPVDMRAAMQDIIKEADDGSPGAQLRQCFADLQNALGKKDRTEIEKISNTAIEICKREHWLDMWSSVLLMRAAGYLGSKDFELALTDYRLAQSVALQGEERSMPGCDKLHVQARVCEGTCLYSEGRFDEAAIAYDEAAKAAEQRKDLFLSLESWRMASFCMERKNKTQPAWEYGKKALAVGRIMNEEQRNQSTLPFLGQALIRLSPAVQVRDQVKITFKDLLGEDWLEKAQEVAEAC